MVRARLSTSTACSRLKRPWRLVGPQEPYATGCPWRSQSGPVRSGAGPGLCALTALILLGPCRARLRCSTAWGAARAPQASVGDARAAPQRHGLSAGRVGVWAGLGCAGLASGAVPAMGRGHRGVWRDTTRTGAGWPRRRSRRLWAGIQRGARPGSQPRPGSLRPTGLARRSGCRARAGRQTRARRRGLGCAHARGSGAGVLRPCSRGHRRRGPGCAAGPARGARAGAAWARHGQARPGQEAPPRAGMARHRTARA